MATTVFPIGQSVSVAQQGDLYRDRWISCTDTHVVIRGYYFPIGTAKSIPYRAIRSARVVKMGALTRRGRIWGTASLRYWAHLDFGRPRKRTALILDHGQRVQPFITPRRSGPRPGDHRRTPRVGPALPRRPHLATRPKPAFSEVQLLPVPSARREAYRPAGPPMDFPMNDVLPQPPLQPGGACRSRRRGYRASRPHASTCVCGCLRLAWPQSMPTAMSPAVAAAAARR